MAPPGPWSGACEKVVDPGKHAAAGLRNSRFHEDWGELVPFPANVFQGNAGNMMIFYGKYWENHSGFSWIFQFSPEIYPLVSQQFAIEHGPVEIVDL